MYILAFKPLFIHDMHTQTTCVLRFKVYIGMDKFVWDVRTYNVYTTNNKTECVYVFLSTTPNRSGSQCECEDQTTNTCKYVCVCMCVYVCVCSYTLWLRLTRLDSDNSHWVRDTNIIVTTPWSYSGKWDCVNRVVMNVWNLRMVAVGWSQLSVC